MRSNKAWRDANPEKWAAISRRSSYKRRYGITLEQYDEMLAAQGDVCAICKQRCKRGGRLAVDHDHDTGAIRGLLCFTCNMGLGYFADNPGLLHEAISYLGE